jgi:uncharacterized protein YggL (DUF469 family)
MLKRPPSAGRLRHLNRRQRKKLRVGGFQDRVFAVRMSFARPLDEAAYPTLERDSGPKRDLTLRP